ncbi:hypothetical protein BZG02_04870 [Labilibaculum filiforme]|uniref:Uncharacterized protein n=1 Tax=Labilibaculum filiforme TaxID=1940526 RepID=A0A2N3I4D7_9BACT|nr:hypothetical protein [Labilibaculum filiforme]PKQ65162.1 hypothetical protein BZG02_04870 [Labilibaculum filiforme]
MDNKLVIQLLKSKTEEIQNLLVHFANKPADLEDGIDLLDSRIQGLSHDFKILKRNCERQPDEQFSVIKSTESTPFVPETIQKEPEPQESNLAKEMEPIITEKIELEEKKTLVSSVSNESIPVAPTQLIGEKMYSHKLADVQSAIGINDRFLFARELFENNMDAYNTAISFVNKAPNFDSVMNWIKVEKEWDLEDPIVVQFIEITKRKF